MTSLTLVLESKQVIFLPSYLPHRETSQGSWLSPKRSFSFPWQGHAEPRMLGCRRTTSKPSKEDRWCAWQRQEDGEKSPFQGKPWFHSGTLPGTQIRLAAYSQRIRRAEKAQSQHISRAAKSSCQGCAAPMPNNQQQRKCLLLARKLPSCEYCAIWTLLTVKPSFASLFCLFVWTHNFITFAYG